MDSEPWAARLHGFARAILPQQQALVAWRRRDIERAPHWVLLTTRGRKTGLPREVLLPCARRGSRVLVISTYGHRAAWLRNVQACPDVKLSARGRIVDGRAEVIEDLARKHALVEEMPFVPLAPLAFVQSLARGALRPLALPWLRAWVAPRPVVLIETGAPGRRPR